MSVTASEAAQYWNGRITRREAREIYDEQRNAIVSLAAQLGRLSAMVSFLFEKSGQDPAELDKWIEEKVKAAQAEKEAAAAPAQA